MASYHTITNPFKRPFHSSMAKALTDGRTPAHVAYDIEHGTTATRSMFLGTLAHKLLLQYDDFAENWEMAETEIREDVEVTIRKSTNKYKNWKAKKIQENKPFYHIEELRTANGMLHSLRNTEWVKDVLAPGGHPELEVKATYASFGLTAAIAIDWLKGSLICDLKKVAKGDAESFGLSIDRYGYDIQAALYVDTFWKAASERSDFNYGDLQFVWICVEENPPHVVSTYFATADNLLMGREKYRKAMSIWSECLKNKEFPGYPPTPQEPVMSYRYNRKAAELNW